jgi:hypothetical protein
MPSPNAPRRTSTKKSPEKVTDLGQKLAKRKSQDFKSKVNGWSPAGAGVAPEQDEIVVIKDGEEKNDDADGVVEVIAGE